MKKTLLISIFLIFGINMFSQIIVQDNKIWNVVHCVYSSSCWTRSFKLNGDTIIDQMNYKILHTTMDTTLTNWSIYGAMREFENKVFFYDFILDSESLMYDFSLSVGETFSTELYSGCPIDMTVQEIDTIVLVNGELRERYVFDNDEQWIKGIGSLNGIIYVGIYLCEADMFYELSCCYENDEQIYQSANFEGCFIITTGTAETNKQKDHLVAPNPFSITTTLKFNYSSSQNYRMFLINEAGQIIQTIENINSGEIVISGNQLNSGIYFYKLQSKNTTIASGKLIIE